MGNFKLAYAITMGHEGGYANDPDDTGGETYKGISRKNFPSWSGWTLIDKIKAGLPKGQPYKQLQASINSIASRDLLFQESVDTFYKRTFWDVNKLDLVKSEAICKELFDTGVNMGDKVAANFLQEAINLCNRDGRDYPDIIQDGIIGNNTLNVLNTKAPEGAVLNTINLLQGERYLNIMRKNKKQRKFWPSWLSRVLVTSKW